MGDVFSLFVGCNKKMPMIFFNLFDILQVDNYCGNIAFKKKQTICVVKKKCVLNVVKL